jgi:hypothetical protein
MTAPAEPHCGRCDYPVRGLPTFACPECGNDLRKVGIVAPGVRPRATKGQRIGNWTILFVIAVIPLWMLADNLLRWRDTTISTTLRSLSGGYEVMFSATETGYGGPLSRRDVELELDLPPPSDGTMRVNSSLQYSHSTGGGSRLTEPVIEAWLTRYRQASPPTTKQEALDLLAMVKAATRDGDLRRRPPIYFEQRGFRYTGRGGGAENGKIAVAFVMLWAIGAWVVARRTQGR